VSDLIVHRAEPAMLGSRRWSLCSIAAGWAAVEVERAVPSSSAVEGFLKTIDCCVMGSRTYETALAFEPKGLGWSYGDKPTVVLTRRALRKTRDSVEFYAGDLGRLIGEKLTPNFRNIWFVGGASLRGANVGSHPSGAHGHGIPTAFAPAAQVTPLALK
jgi:dihydrofolate reductase